MIFVCSVVLADRAFTLQFAGKMLSLSAGDVLLIDDTDREDFWICPYISRHLLSLNPLQARCRRYSRGER